MTLRRVAKGARLGTPSLGEAVTWRYLRGSGAAACAGSSTASCCSSGDFSGIKAPNWQDARRYSSQLDVNALSALSGVSGSHLFPDRLRPNIVTLSLTPVLSRVAPIAPLSSATRSKRIFP